MAGRIVRLKSGGWLEFSAPVEWFKLMPSDQAFLLSLSNAIEEYERSQPKAADQATAIAELASAGTEPKATPSSNESDSGAARSGDLGGTRKTDEKVSDGLA